MDYILQEQYRRDEQEEPEDNLVAEYQLIIDGKVKATSELYNEVYNMYCNSKEKGEHVFGCKKGNKFITIDKDEF